jgi:NAD(P)-dependent dehydrogenase (short-subunit alcohol dehydrogenase family)
MGKLEGQIALIIGGNGGIGLAAAKQFVNEGAYVFITGRREQESCDRFGVHRFDKARLDRRLGYEFEHRARSRFNGLRTEPQLALANVPNLRLFNEVMSPDWTFGLHQPAFS